jgi:ribosomal protein L13
MICVALNILTPGLSYECSVEPGDGYVVLNAMKVNISTQKIQGNKKRNYIMHPYSYLPPGQQEVQLHHERSLEREGKE